MDEQDMSSSQAELKIFYERQKAERMREQQRAMDEQRRLDELMSLWPSTLSWASKCDNFEISKDDPDAPVDQNKNGQRDFGEKQFVKQRSVQPNSVILVETDSEGHISPTEDSGVEFCSPVWSQLPQKNLNKQTRALTDGFRSTSEDRKSLTPHNSKLDYLIKDQRPNIRGSDKFMYGFSPLDNVKFCSDTKVIFIILIFRSHF